MKRLVRKFLWLVFACLCSVPVQGQYYNTGQDPASIRWQSLKHDSVRMIFPDYYQFQARKTLYYMNAFRSDIRYGFLKGPMQVPVVFKTQNALSNGLAMWAPRRIEMIGMPDPGSYSEPWLKQLAVHEYRHMVQFSNMNRSTVKVLGWFFGQQASLVASGLLPFWFLEGDAVMAETQMSVYGRGLQPSFSMHYRALGREILDKKNPDKWFCGSLRDYVPSHYELGYQLVSWASNHYDTYIGERMTDFGSKYPFLLFTSQLALRKYFKTSSGQLFRETFSDLNDYWDQLPHQPESMTRIEVPVTSYTTYSYPLWQDDSTMIVLKSDLDRTSRFVEIDPDTGRERRIAYTGNISSRPVLVDGRLWWTEYRQSIFWEQRVNSRLCYMDLTSGRVRTLSGPHIVLYPTVVGNRLAWVEYDYDGSYRIVCGEHRFDFGRDVSLHGLAYEERSGRLYYIALSDSGMWIGALHPESGEQIEATPAAHITLSDLRAYDGKLFFGSIASGKDEVWYYDPETGCQYQLSTSDYGSFAPSLSPSGKRLALTTYNRNGYLPAVQPVRNTAPVPYAFLPRNLVNPPRREWPVAKMDTVRFTEDRCNESEKRIPARRYSRVGHLFDFHSWAPVDFDPDAILSGGDVDLHLGVTAISQNRLGTSVSSFSYGYGSLDGSNAKHSMLRTNFRYLGWAPKFEVDVLWSDARQGVYQVVKNQPVPSHRHSYLSLSARSWLPFCLTSGYRTRLLTAQVEYQYRNTMLFDPWSNRYETGEHMLVGTVQYSSRCRMAQRDILPRWGYLVQASVGGSPTGSELYSSFWNLYGRLYLPGGWPHHALSLSGAYQQSIESDRSIVGYQVQQLIPRGFGPFSARHFSALSATYYLPVAYPDWGIPSVLFLQRIRLGIGADWASYESGYRWSVSPDKVNVLWERDEIWSYGGIVSFDMVPLRMPEAAVCTLSLSLFFPKNKAPFFSLGFSLPL